MQPAMKHFDTLQATKSIENAGLERPVAEAISETIAQVQSGLATQGDIVLLKGDIDLLKRGIDLLKRDIDLLKGDIDLLKGDIDLLRADIRRLDKRIDGLETKMDEKFDHLVELMNARDEGLTRTLRVALAIVIPVITGNFLAVLGILAKGYLG